MSLKENFKMKKIFFVFIFLFLIFLLFFIKKNLLADEMKSGRFRIQMGNVNIGAGKETSNNNNTLAYTLGQTAAMEFAENGYIVKAGFQYIHSIVPFSFTISDTQIDFGELLPNTPKTETTNLIVSFGGAGNYQVTAIEEGPLATLENTDQIDDTCCDPGCSSPSKCDQYSAALWTQTSTTGFGYKMSGEDIPATFISCGSNCYRRFANRLNDEDPVVVMSSENVTLNPSSEPKDIYHQATVTFKVNIDSLQTAGKYQTIINFVATPSF